MTSEIEDEITRGWLNEAPLAPSRDFDEQMYKRKIFVGFFRKNLSEAALRDYFSRYGKIENIQVLRDGFGVSRGYAFIAFCDEASADTALANKPHTLLGIQLDTKRAFPKDSPKFSSGANYHNDKIFIGGLTKNISKRDISEFFENTYSTTPLFGIEDIIIPIDPSGRSKGFAFVKFSNEDIVDKIICEHPRAEICGRVCEIKRAELREDEAQIISKQLAHTKLNSQEDHGNLHLLSSSTHENEGQNIRLVSSGMEKIRKMNFNIIKPSSNPAPSTTFNATCCVTKENEVKEPVAVPIKRSLKNRIDFERDKKISDSLDQETLARIGKIFIDLISHSVESDSSLSSQNSMSSLLISTLHQIILNVKKSSDL
ncbi:hypothetical protein HZS_5967 [Henneguya salminicola]|nr:hypothetical protein HZS_5967 [Henneguya salminicola]